MPGCDTRRSFLDLRQWHESNGVNSREERAAQKLETFTLSADLGVEFCSASGEMGDGQPCLTPVGGDKTTPISLLRIQTGFLGTVPSGTCRLNYRSKVCVFSVTLAKQYQVPDLWMAVPRPRKGTVLGSWLRWRRRAILAGEKRV